MSNTTVKYFAYGSNRNLEMIAAIIGRHKIVGEKAVLPGFELCIQKIDQIASAVLPDAPAPISPQKTIRDIFGDDFELYIMRINPKGKVHGTIWDISPEEREMVRDWEMLDYGMQNDVKSQAINTDGKKIDVVAEGLTNREIEVDRVVEGDQYDDFIVSKQKIIDVANKSRQEYLSSLKNS